MWNLTQLEGAWMTKSNGFCFVLLSALLVACGSDLSDQAAIKIRDQAAFDLQCDKTKLLVQKISDDASFGGVKNFTYGARGCEKQATYKASCSGWTGCSVMTDAQAAAMQQGQVPQNSAPVAASAPAQPASSSAQPVAQPAPSK
jgi:hypothetical protein